MRELSPKHGPIFLGEQWQGLERRRVLCDQGTLLQCLRVLHETVCLGKLGGVGHELLVRDAGKWVGELRVQIL